MGIFRLRGAGFVAMPRGVAVASLAGGVAVIAFGGVLPALVQRDEAPAPRATLAPAEPDDDASGRGVVGRVQTASGDAVEAAEVELVPLFDDGKKLETTTDERGTFEFPKVEVDPGSPYVAEVTYDGFAFASEILRAPRDDATAIALVVAETTKDDDAITAEAESLAIIGDDAGLQAVHALTLRNTSKRAFTGEVALPFLPGAAAIQEGPGLDRRRLELTDDAIISTNPVLPGRRELTYTYVRQMARSGIDFEREMTRATKRYELLVAGDLDFEPSERLRPRDDVILGPPGEERTYRSFVAENLESGDSVGGRIVVASDTPWLRIGGPIAAGVVALALLLLGLLRRRRVDAPRIAEPAANTT